MEPYAKPLPTLTDANRPFWDGAREGKLKMQKCAHCGHLRYPINDNCPRCLEEKHEWVALGGGGEVFSTIVFHQIYDKAFAGDVPYNVSLIQLDEGPRLFSNVIGIAPNEVKVGQRVSVVFDAVTPEITIPRFRPA